MSDGARITEEQRELLKELLGSAIPISPAPVGNYVTRDEFEAQLTHLETKIDNASLRQKLWVMGGVLSLFVGGISGYTSLVSKIDRLAESMPVAMQKLDERAGWMARTDRRLDDLGQAVHQINPAYSPPPETETPR